MLSLNNSLPIPSDRYGISASGTQFVKNGRSVFSGIGVNHWGSFVNEVTSLGVASDYKVDIAAIKNTWGLPFARVSFGMYSRSTFYNNWWLDKTTFFSKLDSYVAECEYRGLGVVATLFWDIRAFTDALYDITGNFYPVKDLAYKHTVAWQYFSDYVTSIVGRYKNSPAIWAWQLANEPATRIGAEWYYSWKVDGTDAVAGANVNFGTRPNGGNYAPTDKMSPAEFKAFSNNFIELVNSIDPHRRLILSGGALGNSFSVNAQTSNTLGADTLAQWNGTSATENIPWIAFRDKQYSAIEMHIYPQNLSNGRFFSGGEKTHAELIALSKGWADQVGVPFYLAEFGATYWGDAVDETSTNLATEQDNFTSALNAITSNNVAMSSVWNYGGDLAGGSAWMKWKLSDPARTYQLTAIASANAGMSN